MNIGEKVEIIPPYAFQNCDWILFVNTNAKYIGKNTFADCERLVNVTLGDDTKIIRDSAFSGCFRLQNIELGKNIDTVGVSAFEGCVRLNKPVLPDSLKYIGNKAFRRCLLFDGTMTIPSKVSYIGSLALDSCSSITALNMKSSVPPTIFSKTFNTISNTIPVYVPCGKVLNYYTTDYWENFPNITEAPPYVITVTSDNNTMGEAEVSQQPTCTSYQTIIKATANESYHFVSWNDGNISNPRIFNADKDTSFVAYFAQNNAYLTVHSSDSSRGSVTGTGLYDYKQNVTITATPTANNHFVQWNDGNKENPRIISATQDSVFTAVFSSNISNISVMNNNTEMGTVNGSGVFYYQNNIVISATANYGYHFVSWNDGNTDNPRIVTVDRDSVFTANFAVNIYSLSINSSNTTMGYAEGTGSYNYLAQVGISATANYGYHFVSWNDGNTNNPRTVNIERDSSFTAQFTANSYIITTESNDPIMGSAYGGGTYNYNTQKTISATANYGYHFTSWSDGSTENPRTITINNNANYTALFEINTYDITTTSSNPAIGTASGGGTYDYNSPINITATPNYGYHFTQWSDGNTDNPRLITVIQNATYTAQFAINNYAVNVETNNNNMGSVLGNGSYTYNTVATISATANYGYHFTGWSDGSTENPRSFVVTKDESFIAQFDYNLYNITATSANMTLGNIIGAGTYNYNSVISLTAVPSEHYHFLRWNDSLTENPRTLTVIQDSVFTAYFEIDTHQITLLSDNELMGYIKGSGYYNYGTMNAIEALAEYGYHFVKWSDDNTNNPRNIYLTKDTVLIAYFTENTYNVSLYSNDTNMGNVAGSGCYIYKNNAILTATSKYGYHFVSWSDGNTDNPRNLFVDKDTLLQAVFDYNTYNITANTNDNTMGNITGAGDYYYLTDVTLTAVPNENYHFVSWSDGVKNNPRQITLTKDTVITAIFEIDTHFVVLAVNNTELGEVFGGGVYDYNAQTTLSATAVKGYHFSKWNDGNTDNPRSIVVTQDTSFTAYFEIDTFFVSVLSNDNLAGTTDGSGIYDYNSEAVISASANKHYHFVSWSDGNTSNPRIVTIDKDSVFTALFEEDNKYHIQVISSNNTMGTTEGEGVYYEGEQVQIKAVANEHYIFKEWSDGNTSNPRTITVLSDNVYIANFAKAVYTVKVESADLNKGTVQGGGIYEYGDIAVIKAIANKGYKFTQWNDGNTEETRQFSVENNVTYIANFEKESSLQGANELPQIQIYPNPAKDVIIIENVVCSTDYITINIYDNKGGLVLTETKPNATTYTLNTTLLKSGVYYLRLVGVENSRVFKLIKE
ncbi:MAG: leucine-rich repeat domain-containing protein [Bacteroidales bacterium]|nr:leucine-rich repeat domain-containing protein [Bacteroidales bacterium]